MKHQAVKQLLTAMSLAVSAVLVVSCGQQGGLPTSNEYPVASVEATTTELTATYPASIKGKQDVEIRPKISGFITRLCVDEGATVRQGQVLFTIDNVQYRAALNQAQAALNSAKTAQATAELTYNNKKELHDQNIIGDFDLQTAENNLQTAKAAVAQAQAAVSAARDNLSYCNVTSPTSGVIGSIPFRVGSLVGPSMAQPFTTVSNSSEMYVYFSMNEKQVLDMTRVANGNRMTGEFPAVRLQLLDGSIYEHPGKVTTVSGVIDAQGAVQIRADFPNPERLLRSGGSGSIVIPQKAENSIIIPQSATTEVQDKIFVYVVGKDNKVKYTAIEVNPQNDGQNYIVMKGLAVGDRIVTRGITKLTDGMEIKPVTEAEYQKSIEEAQKLGAIQGNYKEMKKAFSKK